MWMTTTGSATKVCYKEGGHSCTDGLLASLSVRHQSASLRPRQLACEGGSGGGVLVVGRGGELRQGEEEQEATAGWESGAARWLACILRLAGDGEQTTRSSSPSCRWRRSTTPFRE